MGTSTTHLQDGGATSIGEQAFVKRPNASIISAREKMNDSDSGATLGGLDQNATELEQVQFLYRWVYDNGDPSEGVNPSLDYLEQLQNKIRKLGMVVTKDWLGWIHIEIYEGRWRPGRYVN